MPLYFFLFKCHELVSFAAGTDVLAAAAAAVNDVIATITAIAAEPHCYCLESVFWHHGALRYNSV